MIPNPSIALLSRFSDLDFELPFFLLISGNSSRWPLLNRGCLNSRQFGSTESVPLSHSHPVLFCESRTCSAV